MSRLAENKIHHVSLLKKHDARINVGGLFSKEYVNSTLLVSIPWFLMDIAIYGIGLFTPIILADMDFYRTAGSPVSIEIGNITGATLIDIFLLMVFFIALWLVPKIGRIRMQLIGFTGTFIGMLIFSLNIPVHLCHQQDMMMIFSGFVIFNVYVNTGPHATTFSPASELFPTHLRFFASGFTAGFAKIGKNKTLEQSYQHDK
jgi:MFS transporter, putative metabolite transport protein